MSTIDHTPQPVLDSGINPVITIEEVEAEQQAEDRENLRLASRGTQLVASIKKSSKYFGQGKEGARFPVSIQDPGYEYVVRGGPGGQYRLADVNLFALVGDKQVKLT
jgi:hypothetical protein